MLKYRLISAFVLIPIVIAALFLLPPMGFAIVTLVVCMLAAWEWGQLSGFTSTSQRVWLAVLYGSLAAIIVLMLWLYIVSMILLMGPQLNHTLVVMRLYRLENQKHL